MPIALADASFPAFAAKDILAGKSLGEPVCRFVEKTGHYGGTIHFNGRPRDKLFHRVTAYVPQEDQMPKYLTVTEAVEFNGQLKFERPSEVSRAMRRQWLQRRLEVLGLENVKDTYIGDGTSLRGISGGQKRRLSLAKRLASGAQVFFCDEPTSGLSATDAESCIRYMKHTASYYNVLVLVVIHQPRIEVANLFDQLLLMTSNPGRIVYNGRMKDVVNYVEQVGFEVPRHANPVDFFMDLITPDTSTCQVEPFDQYYREHVAADVAKRVDEGLKAEMRSGLEILEEQRELLLQWGYVPAMRNSVYGVRFRKQLGIVFMRQLKLRIRDRRGILADLIGALAKAVVVGIVYMRTGELIAAQQAADALAGLRLLLRDLLLQEDGKA
ncbi:unnamed protein product [Effrenium voratum]|nr:unnamed protein product [Effrenium voratum]